jgi:glycerate 2-kinase
MSQTVRQAGAEIAAHGRADLRRDAVEIAARALAAVDPVAAFSRRASLVGDALRIDDDVYDLKDRRVVVLGAGKASIGLAAHLDRLLGTRIAAGCVVVKRGQGRDLRHIEIMEAAHPVPDDASLLGGERLLRLAATMQPEDLVIAIVTGGSSSLVVVPAEGISLADFVATTRLLLASGAAIVHINDVRKHLSRIKGGRLAAACGCTVVNLTVSDVVGDPLDYVTDPTVPDTSTFADAQYACDSFALWDRLPGPVAAHLRRADPSAETIKELRDVHNYVLATSEMMCAAAAEAGRALGYASEVLTLELAGESADAGRWLTTRLRDRTTPTCLITGGETTVRLAADIGCSGGPSQEAALAAALELDGGGPACVLCMDSDGTDGPTDAAGGLVDDLSVDHARAFDLDLTAALAAHTAGDALLAMGDLLVTGSTGTNVNDLRLALTKGASNGGNGDPTPDVAARP